MKDKSWVAVATCFGLGRMPLAPGTFGIFPGIAIYLILHSVNTDPFVYLIAIIALFLIGVHASTRAEIAYESKDDSRIIIDEIVSFPVTMFMIPLRWESLILAFFFNRLLDIKKPFPASRLHLLRRGWGVMLDDIVAAIYSNFLLQIITIFFWSK